MPISSVSKQAKPNNVYVTASGRNITSFHVLFLVQQLLIFSYYSPSS